MECWNLKNWVSMFDFNRCIGDVITPDLPPDPEPSGAHDGMKFGLSKGWLDKVLEYI